MSTTLQKYILPVQVRCDLRLACANTDHAELVFGAKVISSVRPDELGELNFLGGAPLRAGLLAPGYAAVVLYSSEVPSLIMHPGPETTYLSLNSDNLVDEVVITTEAGEKRTSLIYYGYAAELL